MQCNWLSDPVYNHVRLSIPRREDSTTSTCGPARAGRRTPVSRASNRPPIHIQWHRSTRTRRPKTLPSTPHRPAVFLSTDAWKSTLSIAQTSPPAPAAPFKSRYRNCRGRDSSAGPAQLRAAAIPINARDLTGTEIPNCGTGTLLRFRALRILRSSALDDVEIRRSLSLRFYLHRLRPLGIEFARIVLNPSLLQPDSERTEYAQVIEIK